MEEAPLTPERGVVGFQVEEEVGDLPAGAASRMGL